MRGLVWWFHIHRYEFQCDCKLTYVRFLYSLMYLFIFVDGFRTLFYVFLPYCCNKITLFPSVYTVKSYLQAWLGVGINTSILNTLLMLFVSLCVLLEDLNPWTSSPSDVRDYMWLHYHIWGLVRVAHLIKVIIHIMAHNRQGVMTYDYGITKLFWITLKFMNYKKVKNTSILSNGYGLLPKILMFVTRLLVGI